MLTPVQRFLWPGNQFSRPGPSSDLESLGCRISSLKTPIWSIKYIKCGSWWLLWAILESVSSAPACHHLIRSWPDPHLISSFHVFWFETKLEVPNNGHKIPNFIFPGHLQIKLLLQWLYWLNSSFRNYTNCWLKKHKKQSAQSGVDSLIGLFFQPSTSSCIPSPLASWGLRGNWIIYDV